MSKAKAAKLVLDAIADKIPMTWVVTVNYTDGRVPLKRIFNTFPEAKANLLTMETDWRRIASKSLDGYEAKEIN